jgi:transcriptional regulator with XRE-family HTH domain
MPGKLAQASIRVTSTSVYVVIAETANSPQKPPIDLQAKGPAALGRKTSAPGETGAHAAGSKKPRVKAASGSSLALANSAVDDAADSSADAATHSDTDAASLSAEVSPPTASSEPAGQDAVTSEAAESLLEAKHLGARIKHLRQRKQMGLVELGRYTGLSASFLSQLETGRVVPTLRNLARIAMVFSRDLSYFFEPDEPELFRIVRAQERHRLPQTGADVPGYFYESLGQVPGFTPNGQKVTPYIAEFLPTSETHPPRSHQHSGAEFLYVLSGQLKLTHDGKEEAFEEGDAVYFHADTTHSYDRIGDQTCTALILTMPLPTKGHR